MKPHTTEAELESRDISKEEWREYEWMDRGETRVYRIEHVSRLYVGQTTHRVVDVIGVVHCVPAPGCFGCVLRWKGPVLF